MLAKLRVNALVVATTAGGYCWPGRTTESASPGVNVCFGTALVASGAAAINQVHEHDTDRLMNRTRHRPVADGRMTGGEGALSPGSLALAGLVTLAAASTLAARSSRSRRS